MQMAVKEHDFKRSIGAEVRAVEGEDRTIELSFSSEVPYDRWFGPEILDHSDGCVNMDRIRTVGCLLFNHDRDKVIGKILEANIVEGRGVAKVRFDDTDDFSETIYKKVQNGTLTGVSVGYRVDNWEEVEIGKKSEDGRFVGPCYIAKRWFPYEISIVSVPADATVGVGRSMEDELPKNNGRQLDWFVRQLRLNFSK